MAIRMDTTIPLKTRFFKKRKYKFFILKILIFEVYFYFIYHWREFKRCWLDFYWPDRFYFYCFEDFKFFLMFFLFRYVPYWLPQTYYHLTYDMVITYIIPVVLLTTYPETEHNIYFNNMTRSCDAIYTNRMYWIKNERSKFVYNCFNFYYIFHVYFIHYFINKSISMEWRGYHDYGEYKVEELPRFKFFFAYFIGWNLYKKGIYKFKYYDFKKPKNAIYDYNTSILFQNRTLIYCLRKHNELTIDKINFELERLPYKKRMPTYYKYKKELRKHAIRNSKRQRIFDNFLIRYFFFTIRIIFTCVYSYYYLIKLFYRLVKFLFFKIW